jgi:hypothetical protein
MACIRCKQGCALNFKGQGTKLWEAEQAITLKHSLTMVHG